MSLIAKKKIDLMYVEGPGDVVEVLRKWHKQEDVLSETSQTFSGQVFDFCKKNHLNTLALSAFPEKKSVTFENFSAYSKPKITLSGGLGYHIAQVIHGLRILATAIRIRPKYLHITNGVTHWFVLAPLKLFGIKIFPHFHNTFWAKGYPPQGKLQRILLALDAWFLTYIATSVACCSPEIKRQIEEITHNKNCPVYVFKAQFYRSNFENLPPSRAHSKKPFVVVFAGRIERNKGVFDILKMADKLRNENIIFHICGDGPMLEELKNECAIRKLENHVFIHGRLNRPELLAVYTQGHAVIVPTRSNFSEGFAMVAAEAILLDKVIISSSIVPALETLREASIEARPDEVDSYVAAIQRLATDQILYEQMCAACLPLKEQFLDRKEGLTNILEKTLVS